MSSSEPLSLWAKYIDLLLFLIELFNIYPNAINIKKVFRLVIEYCKI